MPTLFEQPARKSHSINYDDVLFLMREYERFSEEYEIPFEVFIRAYEMLEMRRKNDLYQKNGDAFDEQMSGFGKLFVSFNSKISKLIEILEAIEKKLDYEPVFSTLEEVSEP